MMKSILLASALLSCSISFAGTVPECKSPALKLFAESTYKCRIKVAEYGPDAMTLPICSRLDRALNSTVFAKIVKRAVAHPKGACLKEAQDIFDSMGSLITEVSLSRGA